LPNFPSQKIYNSTSMQSVPKKDDCIRIIYQGTIGKGHSIEEIVTLLNTEIQGKKLHLTLKGKVKEAYKNSIDDIAEKYGVLDKLSWIGIGSYKEVQEITKQNHIGIAIHLGDVPQGTASNKIYEYAACGLPALVYDNEQFRKHLSKYKWAVFTDGSVESLRNAIEYCYDNFENLSKEAKKDFNTNFFFEKNFEAIKQYLKTNSN
ncbi:MAG: glycosyltransferase, partial [Chitinophagaceae bacterium]